MKRFYTMLLGAIVGMVCSLGAQAQQPINLILNVDRADAVEWKYAYGAEWQTLGEGDNAIAVDPYSPGATYYYLMIRPKMGFKVNSILSADPDSYGDMRTYELAEMAEATFYPTTAWEGWKFNITTTDINATRTGELTVNITGDPSIVKARLKGGSSDITFAAAGESVIKFDPATETPVTFSATNSKPFYSFKLGDTEVAPTGSYSSYSYEVTPAASGDRVEIETTWPDLDVDFTVNVPEDVKDCVTKVEKQSGWSYEAIEWKLNEAFKVKAGNRYKVTFNSQDFNIGAVRVNGELQSGTYSVDFFVGKDAVVVDIEATVKEVFKFILRTDKDGEAEYDTTGYGISYKKLVAGDNVIKPEESYWGGYNSIYLKATTDYKLTRVYCPETEEELTVPSDPTNSMTLTPNDSWQDRVYVVETVSLDESRTGTVGVTITDNPDAVVRHQRANQDFAIGAAGERVEVKFDPATESVFTFAGASVPLREVLLNGTPVETESPSSTTHKITVADGDEIVITANYDDVDIPVTINVPEEAKGVISKVQLYNSYPYEDIEYTINEPFFVKAGNRVAVDLNKTDYNVNSVTLNGTPVDVMGSIIFFVKDEAIDIDIDAAPFGTFKFTVNVTDPSHVRIYPGSSTYGVEPYELTGTVNQLEVSEKKGNILIKPAKGCFIKSITDGEGNKPQMDSWTNDCYIVTDGMTFNIESAEIEYDGKLLFWFDSLDNFDSSTPAYYVLTSASTDYVNLTQPGFNEIKFATAAPEEHKFVIYPKEYGYLYANGELIYQSSSWGPTIYAYYTPENNDVLRCYGAGEPAKFDLTFNVVGENPSQADDVKVTVDKIRPQDNWRDGLNLLEQSLVWIEAPEGMGVSLDGNSLERGEDGKYEFVTSAPHEVTLSTMSGVINIESENAASTGAVYNMQGIKVLDHATKAELKKLPAGIYIVNGEKKVIR